MYWWLWVTASSVGSSPVTPCGSGSQCLVDGKKVAHVLDGGVGAMSTAGTSRLLYDYPPQLQSDILDFLFKPQFGASMHHLKVALGGEGETTCGSESATMRSSDDQNYNRGYELWLLAEAKKRNPDILTYGLPLSFPAWVHNNASAGHVTNNGRASPYDDVAATADYVTKWVIGAKVVWNVTIDFIGLWNERPYTKAYVMALRHALDGHGLQHTKIVGSDHRWDPISTDVLKDPELRSAIAVLSAHYPGTWPSLCWLPYTPGVSLTADQA